MIPELDGWLKQCHTITALVQQQLLRAQQRMKHQADKHRVERQFVVGDLVWLKIQPYVQSSLATRICTKLAYKYFGPYEVEAKVGSVAISSSCHLSLRCILFSMSPFSRR